MSLYGEITIKNNLFFVENTVDITCILVIDHTKLLGCRCKLDVQSDAAFDFSSDCLMNASNKLIDHVTTLFKWFLATGKIPALLLLCTLVPIVKDNLDDIATSDNYRAIAIWSLILKWFDWLI